MRFSGNELHISGRIVIVALSVNVVSAVLIIVVVVGVVVVGVVIDGVVNVNVVLNAIERAITTSGIYTGLRSDALHRW